MATKPPVEVPQGALRFNTDSHKLEFYAQDQWWEMATDVPNLGGNGNASTAPTGNSADQSPGARGVFAGMTPDASAATDAMDYINITTTGNAIDFGDSTLARLNPAGCSDSHGGIS